MSTQQQINAWNAAVAQKEQERADQQTILKVEQEQLAKAEDARINAELAVQRAQSSGASPEQVAALQRQVRLADSAESDARIAASRTEDNISKLDGSIRYNTAQRDLYQGSVPAQANPASTVGDGPANVQSDAAEIAPAPTPAANSPAPVPRSAIEEGGDAKAQEALAVRNAEAAAADDPFETARLAREAEEPPPTFEAEDLEDSPYEVARLAGEEEGDGPTLEAPDPADDPYEAARLAAEEGEPPPTLEAEDLEDSPYEIARQAGEDAEGPPAVFEAEDLEDSPYEIARRAGEEGEEGEPQPAVFEPDPVPGSTQPGLADPAQRAQAALTPEQQAANEQAAAKANAINQATLNSVYKKAGSEDWRVRLQLAPTSNYLYNVPVNPDNGLGPGILGPLAATNGVIFPYTPQINTSYKANYEQYDLVHSNYRGVYYKNSRVDDISIRGVFTAQDTREADYLLAVIHFFRSVTKMFYGKDEQRGSPPPLVYLSGLGPNQFNGHPCVVASFQYNLPDQVDYIRATSVNNYGTDLLSRRTPSKASGVAGLGATGNRILNAGLERFFPAAKPAPDPVVGSVNSIQLANYVPTKMEIDITLIPVQTRSQVSKQFSLKGFANGDLIKGGFW